MVSGSDSVFAIRMERRLVIMQREQRKEVKEVVKRKDWAELVVEDCVVVLIARFFTYMLHSFQGRWPSDLCISSV